MTPRLQVSLQVKARGPKLRDLGKKGGLGGTSTPGRRGICHRQPPQLSIKHNLTTPEVQKRLLDFFFFTQKHHESQFPEPAILKGLGSQEPK